MENSAILKLRIGALNLRTLVGHERSWGKFMKEAICKSWRLDQTNSQSLSSTAFTAQSG